MNEIINENIKIKNMIYVVRDVEVMFDSDLAKLYCVETKRINETVKTIWTNFLKDIGLEYPMRDIIL